MPKMFMINLTQFTQLMTNVTQTSNFLPFPPADRFRTTLVWPLYCFVVGSLQCVEVEYLLSQHFHRCPGLSHLSVLVLIAHNECKWGKRVSRKKKISKIWHKAMCYYWDAQDQFEGTSLKMLYLPAREGPQSSHTAHTKAREIVSFKWFVQILLQHMWVPPNKIKCRNN